jgi:hypothetical protein
VHRVEKPSCNLCPTTTGLTGLSNGEGVLLALLYQRRLCTLDVLAGALGGVSRSAVGNVIRQTLPLLQHEDSIPAPAPARYRTAADLLAAGATNDTTS